MLFLAVVILTVTVLFLLVRNIGTSEQPDAEYPKMTETTQVIWTEEHKPEISEKPGQVNIQEPADAPAQKAVATCTASYIAAGQKHTAV